MLIYAYLTAAMRADAGKHALMYRKRQRSANGCAWSLWRGCIRHRIAMAFVPRSSSSQRRDCPTMGSLRDSTRRARSSANGVNDFAWPACPALRACLAADARPAFPPSLVVQVKALACELPHRLGVPLSRLSIAEIRQHVIAQGLVAEISGATPWRWLSSDAFAPLYPSPLR
jgi:hypothetical protein